MRLDRRIGSIEGLYDATASALRVTPRMQVREVNNDTQLRTGELLVVNLPALERRIIRLPGYSSGRVGIVSSVTVYGEGYVIVVPPPGMSINKSDRIYINSRSPADFVLINNTTYYCNQTNYTDQTTAATSVNVEMSNTSGGASDYLTISGNDATVIRYPGESVIIYVTTEVYTLSTNETRVFVQLYNNTAATEIIAHSWNHTGQNDFMTIGFHQRALDQDAGVPVGSTNICVRSKIAGNNVNVNSIYSKATILRFSS